MMAQVLLHSARTLHSIPPAEHPQPSAWAASNICVLAVKCRQTWEEVKRMQADYMEGPAAWASISWASLSKAASILSKQQFNNS